MARAHFSITFCIAAVLLITNAQAAPAGNPGYAVKTRTSINGNDFSCGQTGENDKAQPFCLVSGGVTAVADACDSYPACKFFVMQGSDSGYLKTGGTPIYTEGSSTFCKVGTPGCSGTYVMLRRTNVKGNDINCNLRDVDNIPQSTCTVSGDIIEHAAACDANPKCKAITVQGAGGLGIFTALFGFGDAGYLKSAKPATPPVFSEGWVTYVKNT